MPPAYDDAVAALHRAPFDDFVAERKRLAAELKASGDTAGAARLSKYARPTISAWAVNHLWWNDREGVERLFLAARRLREGDTDQSREHRQALTHLRERARAILSESGHGSGEATLRRVSATLSALAANSGFDPDAPGALTTDRDPPGFDLGAAEPVLRASASPAAAPSGSSRDHADQSDARTQDDARAQIAAERERLRREEEDARRRAERQRLETELRDVERALQAAALEIEAKRRQIEKLEIDIGALEDGIVRARARAQELSARLADGAPSP
jgi:hypothetical protein